MRILIIASAIFLTLCLTSCHNDSYNPHEGVYVQRLDIYTLTHINTDSLDENMRPTMSTYLNMMGYGTELTDSTLLQLHDSPTIQIFGRDIATIFGSRDTLDELPASLLDSLNFHLNTHIKYIATIASPYMQSVMLSDSTLFIALNHYLGVNYEGYSSMPEYLRKNKRSDRIPYDVTEAIIRISNKYEPNEGTLLERMLYEGAIVYAISQFTRSQYDEASGFLPEEYKHITTMMQNIWQNIATDNLLYSHQSTDISRIFEPSPFVTIKNMQLPGQVGKIIGANIISSYMKNNPSTTINELLSPEFYGHAQQRLIEARFNP